MRLFSTLKKHGVKCLIFSVMLISVTSAIHGSRQKSLNDYYYRNEIKVGDLFESKGKQMMIAIETNKLILIPSVCWFESYIRLVTVTLPVYGWKEVQKSRKVEPNPKFNYDYKKAVAMAKRLLDKALPHQVWFCSRSNWEAYILFGVTHKTGCVKDCPLARSLEGVSPEDISSISSFTFMDGKGNPYYFKIWKPVENVPPEPDNEYINCCGDKVCAGKHYPPGTNCLDLV